METVICSDVKIRDAVTRVTVAVRSRSVAAVPRGLLLFVVVILTLSPTSKSGLVGSASRRTSSLSSDSISSFLQRDRACCMRRPSSSRIRSSTFPLVMDVSVNRFIFYRIMLRSVRERTRTSRTISSQIPNSYSTTNKKVGQSDCSYDVIIL